MDNLSAHKVAGVRETIEADGARLLYLPPYSPDFKPIEPRWGKVKLCLRKTLWTGFTIAAICPHQLRKWSRPSHLWEP